MRGRPQQPSTPEVNAAEAAALIDEGAFLLDVREPEEWLAGRAPAATHIPLGDLAAQLDDLPKDRKIVIVCRSGGRSGVATDALVQRGYDAVNLGGGMQAWAETGRAVVTDGDAEGYVA